MNQVLRNIVLFLYKFNSISFYHILRGLNSQEDLEANKYLLQGKGILTINGTDSQVLIP